MSDVEETFQENSRHETKRQISRNGQIEDTVQSKKQKTSNGEFTLYERWDKEMLTYILDRIDSFEDENKLASLHRVNSKVNSSSGILRVNYVHSKYAKFGRVYGEGFQSCLGWVRRLCAYQFYHDIDIINCFPVILEQVAQRFGIDCSHLTKYVEEREEILQQDLKDHGINREEAKKAYLQIMFGGQRMYNSPFLIQFQREIKMITKTLWKNKEFKLERECAVNKNKENLKGSFLSLVIGRFERQIIDVAMASFRENGWCIDSYVFDGFMVRKRDSCEIQSIMKLAEQQVLRSTGFTVKLCEKSLLPTEQDLLKLRPQFNNFTVRDYLMCHEMHSMRSKLLRMN